MIDIQLNDFEFKCVYVIPSGHRSSIGQNDKWNVNARILFWFNANSFNWKYTVFVVAHSVIVLCNLTPDLPAWQSYTQCVVCDTFYEINLKSWQVWTLREVTFDIVYGRLYLYLNIIALYEPDLLLTRDWHKFPVLLIKHFLSIEY